MAYKNRKLGFSAFRLFILVFSVLVLLHIVDIRTVISQIRNISIFIIIVLVIISTFRAWLTSLRWQMLNPDISGQLSKWQYFRLTMISHTYNLIMPGALGGDFARTAITVNTVKNNRAENVIAIIVDRFIGLLSILFLGLLAFILAKDIPFKDTVNVFFLISIVLFISVFIATNHTIINSIQKKITVKTKIGKVIFRIFEALLRTLAYFKANKRKVLLALLLCVPIHLISFLSTYMLARSIGININFFSICLITAIVWLITAVPITISGAGVRELSMIYLYSLYGVSAEEATALAAFTYVISILMAFVGLFFFIDLHKHFLSTVKQD